MNVYKNTIAAPDGCELVLVEDGEHQNRVEYGDILFTQSSETLEEVGLSSVWLHKASPFLNSFCFGFHFAGKEMINPRFIAYSLRTSYMREKIIREGQGATRYNLSSNRLKPIKLVYPSYQEQSRIASLMSRLETRIEKQQELICTLKKYKRGVLSVLLTSKDNPYYSAETWKEVSLGDVASGFEYGMNAAATIYDGSHKYIRITDIDDSSHRYTQDSLVSPEGQVEEKYRVLENDILFARTGASVGKSYCYLKSDGELYFAGFLIRIHVNSGVDCSYVFQNTLTEAYRRWVMLESARSGQPGINAEQYKQYRFLLPPIEIQKKISLLASNLDVRISKGESLLSHLEQTKAALLQQLFI